jgi:23S rRNA (adenine2503-C2)-methyltransferase
MKKNIKDYDLNELTKELENIGEKKFRAEQIFRWLYVEKVKSFDEMTNLSLELRNKLKENFEICNFKILRKLVSKDGTIKYLFGLDDGNAIESVLMQYHFGKTVCVSSQIGCKMGCKFCASTGIPFIRSLSSGEIVEQIIAIEQDIREDAEKKDLGKAKTSELNEEKQNKETQKDEKENELRVSNVVFMGIGEPMDNFDNVLNAISILNNPKGLNIGARHISVSTSGVVPRIYEFADKNIQCTLSISLHSADDEIRSSMMPVNNAYNIEELMKACKYYIAKTNKRISFEYALAKDNNDNLKDAQKLVDLLHGMLCHVNLIPINKIDNGKYQKSSMENIIKFRDYLNDHGITATIRRELGSDINAACGQLRRQTISK